jgi:hypothetical protein
MDSSESAGAKSETPNHAFAPLVRSMRMASRSDMSDLLRILAKYDEFQSSNSCCTSIGPPAFSVPSWSSNFSLEVEFGEIKTIVQVGHLLPWMLVLISNLFISESSEIMVFILAHSLQTSIFGWFLVDIMSTFFHPVNMSLSLFAW